MTKTKVRVLEFADTDEGRERFGFIYQGFLSGGNSVQAKGMEVVRCEARILDKMDAVSYEGDGGQRHPSSGLHRVVLSQQEYELVTRYFEGAAWNTVASRKVVNISDWLAGIPQTEE